MRDVEAVVAELVLELGLRDAPGVGLEQTRAEPLPRGAFLEHLLEGVRYVRTHRVVRTLMGLLAVAMLFGWGYASGLLAFLIGGNMAVAASGQGGVLVRVDPDQSDTLVATTDAYLMEMRGRSMQGWLRVDSEHVGTKRRLAKWVDLGTAYARSLPAKR